MEAVVEEIQVVIVLTRIYTQLLYTSAALAERVCMVNVDVWDSLFCGFV